MNLLWNGYNNNNNNNNSVSAPTTTNNKGDEINIGDEITTTTSMMKLPIDLEASMTAFYRAIDLGDDDAKYFIGETLHCNYNNKLIVIEQ